MSKAAASKAIPPRSLAAGNPNAKAEKFAKRDPNQAATQMIGDPSPSPMDTTIELQELSLTDNPACYIPVVRR